MALDKNEPKRVNEKIDNKISSGISNNGIRVIQNDESIICVATEAKERNTLDKRGSIPLTLLGLCQKANIAFMEGDEKVVKRLSDLGLTPMSEVLVVRNNPGSGPVEILVRRTRLAIAKSIANNIFVKRL